MPEPRRRKAIKPRRPRRPLVPVPKKLSRKFMDTVIGKCSKIADLGSGEGLWARHAKTVNPKAYVHAIEGKHEFDPDQWERGKPPRNPRRKLPEIYSSYRGFEHWLRQPEKYDLVNSGLFLVNYFQEVSRVLADRIAKRFKEQTSAEEQLKISRSADYASGAVTHHALNEANFDEIKKEEFVKRLAVLREKKLRRGGVLRAVEYAAALDRIVALLEKAGFKKIVWRRIPKAEALTEYEQDAAAGDQYEVHSGQGPPYEIYAFA